jgi:hypothetical protein
MSILRHGDKPSTKTVNDDYGITTEPTNDLAPTDKKNVPYAGIADNFNYGGATGSKKS